MLYTVFGVVCEYAVCSGGPRAICGDATYCAPLLSARGCGCDGEGECRGARGRVGTVRVDTTLGHEGAEVVRGEGEVCAGVGGAVIFEEVFLWAGCKRGGEWKGGRGGSTRSSRPSRL